MVPIALFTQMHLTVPEVSSDTSLDYRTLD